MFNFFKKCGKKRAAAILLVMTFLWMGCASTKTLDDSTSSATLWMQNAAEYTALSQAIYQTAASRLNSVLNDSSVTADLDQNNQDYQNLPPAIILDIDETVLDNSAFQARLIKQHKSYSPEEWNQWVREEKADAIPGALTFTKKAAAKGITIFYVTNREAVVERATFDNLKKLGFPLKDNMDVILTKNERPDWTSSKVNRREFVAKDYRILMLFGDNLNDFMRADNVSNDQRKGLVQEHSDQFGNRWFILPNPVYGSWQQALYNFDKNLTPREIKEQKIRMLHTKNEY